MLSASEIESISSGVSIWRLYDPAVKADLYSTALTMGGRTYLIDPIPLACVALAQLAAQSPIAGIVITNENHVRATPDFTGRFPVPVYFHPELSDRVAWPSAQPIQDAGSFVPGLTAIAIEGAAAGEIALYSDADRGALVVGDALINLEPYGFTFLPAKYCSNPKAMRRSLTQLLDYSLERILFAHGTPIVSDAQQRLKMLLEQG